MDQTIFSWQQEDYKKLCRAFAENSKIILIHGKDFESPYHVISSLCMRISNDCYSLLSICSHSSGLCYPYLPFTEAICNAFAEDPTKKSLIPVIVKDFTKSDTLATIVDNFICEQHSSISLSDRENELMMRLEFAVNDGTPVFLIRGFSNFDENSQKLTTFLLSGQLDDAFPFLKESRFLFLCENGDDSSIVLQHIKLLEHIDIHLTDPQPANIAEILSEICPDANFLAEDQAKIFHLSGGRLSVIEFLSRYLQNACHSIIDQSAQEVVSNTLAERISKMGELGDKLESILTFAANIGNSFDVSLLKKATEPVFCESILQRSENEYFATYNNKTGKFTCDEIWNYFISCTSTDRRQEIAKILEQAVYYFDPFDYLTRAHYLEQASLYSDACELYILSYNSIYLEGIVPDGNIVKKIATLSDQCGIEQYWHDLKQVYTLMDRLDYDNCVYLLESMAIPSSKRLLLLKEYLTGFCLHKLGETSEQQKDAMLSLQMVAEHARNFEDGIWCDCQTSLISFFMNSSGDIISAKQALKELTYYYTEKSFSAFAQKGRYALCRKWNAIFSVERAVSKTEESVKYFRNSQYPSQYLMALNNHAANLILLSCNTEAMDYLDEALSVLKLHPSIPINRMYLLNNYVLCAVLSGRLEPDVAYRSLLPIISKKDFADWTIIFKLNCSIYLALSGDIEAAEKSLYELEYVVRQIEDDYYLFYVYANLAAVLYLRGKRSEAVQILGTRCTTAPALFKATEKVYAETRTRNWIAIMNKEVITNPREFDTYLLKNSSIQTQGQFWARGFLYSDIQFWSEW